MRIFVLIVVVIVLLGLTAVGLGIWVFTAETPEIDADASMQERLVRSHSYLTWSRRRAHRTRSGIATHLRGHACPGYNLFCSSRRPEAYLMDMEGRVVHVWWNEKCNAALVWEGARLLPDGGLIVCNKFHEVLRFDWRSQLLWRKGYPAHHDVALAPDGTFQAIVADLNWHRELVVRFPMIAHLSADGEVLDIWSTFTHLAALRRALDPRSFLDTEMDRPGFEKDKNRIYDYFHLNSVAILGPNPHDDRPAFRPGNLLICLRNVNQIAILDGKTRAILWSWGEGDLEWPHHPTLLENGNILVYDNGVQRESTRVVEMNPIRKTIVWQYPTRDKDRFFSRYKGSSQRLPNGNTLICDGENGRAVEVTNEGRKVWEWLHPEINDQGHRATLYRMIRHPREQIDHWLTTPGPNHARIPSWGKRRPRAPGKR